MTKSQKARAGRPRQVSTEKIVEAAVSIGFVDLSMSSVAAALGVNHSTLYNYVSSREELISLMIDHIFSNADWPPPLDPAQWRDDALAQVLCHFHLNQDNPGLVGEQVRLRFTVDSKDGYREGYWRYVRRLRATLAHSGLPPADVILLADILINESTGQPPLGWRLADRDTASLRGVDDDLKVGLLETSSMSPETYLRRRLRLVLPQAGPESARRVDAVASVAGAQPVD